jgi:SynChlorMet cassette radical SAM/SPASM protein ScmF
MTDTPPLQRLYFYLTEGCNMACRHCWLAPALDPTGRKHPTLPVDAFATAIREAKPLGLTGVKLTGGEPLLHPDFLRLLEIVREQELSVTIETNGFLCTPEIAQAISKVPDRFVSVSIDGADAATHDRIRGVRGAFERACEAVRNLAAAELKPQMIMTLMRSNVDQLQAVIRLAENLGAASLKFNLVQPIARGKHLLEGDEAISVAELIALGRRVDGEVARTTSINLHFDYPLAFQPLSRLHRDSGGQACGILGVLGVLANGSYALCGIGEVVEDLVFGRVGTDPLADVWRKSPALNAIRDGVPAHIEGICQDCLMKERCLGACVAQTYYRTGSLLRPFWFCEQAQETGLFPATRTRSAKAG